MNNIKSHCDTIYRTFLKAKSIVEIEAAETKAIMDYYGKMEGDVYAIELEKSGRLKTLKHKINERLDHIHTSYLRMVEELDIVDIFKEFTPEDIDPAAYEKHKNPGQTKAALSKLKTAAKKEFEAKLLEVLVDKNLVSDIIRVINDARKLAAERKHEISDLGGVPRKYTSKYID